jgi:uncharacterized membrane protein YeaQ/YmgE (transglycosylase-associated protein family)
VEILTFILFGLVIGVIAKLVVPGKDPGGIIVTAIVGMVGSLLGGLIGRYVLGWGEGYAPGWIMSIAGAVVLLLLARLVARKRES